MIITRVERLRSRQARYRITFDDGEPLLLTEDQLVRFGLATGDEIPAGRLDEMREATERDAAKQTAYMYISYRPRSEQEIRQHLRKKGFTAERARQTVADFVRLNLVDDTTFAAMVVRDAVARGRTGPAAVRRKLMQKGIARDVIDGLLREHLPDDTIQRQANELLRKRIAQTGARLKALDPVRRRARLYQYLCQRGFSGHVAARALKSIEV